MAEGVTQVKRVGWSIVPRSCRRMWRGMRSRPDAIAQISLYPGAGQLARSVKDMLGHLKQKKIMIIHLHLFYRAVLIIW